MAGILEDRKEIYSKAIQAAKSEGSTSKVRRYERGLKVIISFTQKLLNFFRFWIYLIISCTLYIFYFARLILHINLEATVLKFIGFMRLNLEATVLKFHF